MNRNRLITFLFFLTLGLLSGESLIADVDDVMIVGGTEVAPACPDC